MDNEFLDRIILDRDYKISILRENIEIGDLDVDILYRFLNDIARLQYRYFGHSDILNLTEKSTVDERLQSIKQSLMVLDKSIAFVDGVVAALSTDSQNRHLLKPYHGRNGQESIRDKILVNGKNQIFDFYNSC